MNKFAISVILILMTLFSVVFSENSIKATIGTVVLRLGAVSRYDVKGNKDELKEYSQVYGGDRVATGDSGFLKVRIIDESVVRLGNNAIFLFKQYEIRSTLEKKAELIQEKGPIRAIFKVKTNIGTVRLKSSAITANVDGSEFVADLYKKGESAALQRMAVLSGQVKVGLLGERPVGTDSVTVHKGELLQYDPVAGTVDVSKMKKSEEKRLSDNKDAVLPEIEYVEVEKPKREKVRKGNRGMSQ